MGGKDVFKWGRKFLKKNLVREVYMKKIESIMVPIDFSDTLNLLIEYAITFAKKFKAKLYVVHIVEDFSKYSSISVPHISMDNVMEEVYNYAKVQLKKLGDEKFEGKVKYEFMIEKGVAYKKILEFAEEKSADLILIGTHGMSGLDKILFGSTAERVVRGAKCPVIMINPHQPD